MRSLLIDKINSITSSHIHGQKYLSINEDIYEYHFPNNPIMPAAYMVECCLQLARISVWEKSDFQYTLIPKDMRKYKFFKIVRPGSVLNVKNEYLNTSETINLFDEVQVKSTGESEEDRIFEGFFSCKVVPFEELHNEHFCRSYLEYLKGNIYERN